MQVEQRRRAAALAVAIALAQQSDSTEPHEFPLPPTAIVSAWQAVMRTRMLNKRGPTRRGQLIMKYYIKIEDQTYEVEILDLHARPIVVIVDGERFEVEPQNGQSQELKTATSTGTAEKSELSKSQPPAATFQRCQPRHWRTRCAAPIPGVIVALLVRPGDQVSHGQDLCTIEAMKMRNNIRASHPGQIAEVLVSTGQTVNHNDPLIRFEEQA